MKLKSTIIVVCSLLLTLQVCAANVASYDLQTRLAALKHLTANFKQVVLDANGKILQTSHGIVALSRPDKLRWEVSQGNKQIIIANHGKIWIYDPTLQQVVIKKLKLNVQQIPLLLLTQTHVKLQQYFQITKLATTPVTVWQLIPKKSKFLPIIISFKHKTLDQMKFTNQLGQQIVVTFTNVATGAPPLDFFTFVIPPNVDIIHE